MKYRYTYSQPLDVYRIWDGEHWIADAHSLFNAELIVEALSKWTTGPANSSAASKPDPSPSTHGNRQHSTPDAIEPPSSVPPPSPSCLQAGSDNLVETLTTRTDPAEPLRRLFRIPDDAKIVKGMANPEAIIVGMK